MVLLTSICKLSHFVYTVWPFIWRNLNSLHLSIVCFKFCCYWQSGYSKKMRFWRFTSITMMTDNGHTLIRNVLFRLWLRRAKMEDTRLFRRPLYSILASLQNLAQILFCRYMSHWPICFFLIIFLFYLSLFIDLIFKTYTCRNDMYQILIFPGCSLICSICVIHVKCWTLTPVKRWKIEWNDSYSSPSWKKRRKKFTS